MPSTWADMYCVVVIGSSERGPIALADVIFPSLFPSWSILVVDKNLIASFNVLEGNVLILHHMARDGLKFVESVTTTAMMVSRRVPVFSGAFFVLFGCAVDIIVGHSESFSFISIYEY